MNRSNSSASDRSNTSAGSDFLQLDVKDAPAGALADWLAGQLRRAISDGRLPVGGRLPATRVLAADLRVSRGVVTEAYQRLTEDGHIAGRGRSGTVVVAAPLPGARANGSRANGSRVNGSRVNGPVPRAPFAGAPGADVFDVIRAAPARIDLSPGVPDLAAFPRAVWLRAERAVLRDLSAAAFGYGDPRGTPALRLAVADWLARNRGIRADPDEVIVVAGVAQALTLLGEVLAAGGTRAVAVEDPGALGARQHLAARGWTPRRSRSTRTASGWARCGRAARRPSC